MKRISQVFAAALVLLTAPIASASDHAVDGVRADLRHGVLEVKGSDDNDTVALRLAAGDPLHIQVDVGNDGSPDFSFARADVGAIDVKLGDGNDFARIDDVNGSFTNTIPTTIAGGDGNDTLIGGAGAETFLGGDGNDAVTGGRGADTAYLGDGDDSFRWDNGDGSDVIEGQDGTDTMVFNGSPGTDTADMSANGGRLRFFRQQGSVTMDTDGVEIVDFRALTGADSLTVGDLSGTDVQQTNVDLAAALGGSAPDGLADSVTVNGTEGDDNIAVNGNGSGADVTGLSSTVSVTHADPALDRLDVEDHAGNDHVAVNGVAGLIQLLVDGVPSA
jgi:Ca2+-binding RTX toxin-like protein